MKSNLVKILATLGLIIAIAVILKSVFGIGKIGVSKITNSGNSNIIVFDKCYPPDEYASFDDLYKGETKLRGYESHKYEIDLTKREVVWSSVRSDASIQSYKEKGVIVDKLRMETWPITAFNDKIVKATIKGNNETVDYFFNLENGEETHNKKKGNTIIFQSLSLCEVN